METLHYRAPRSLSNGPARDERGRGAKLGRHIKRCAGAIRYSRNTLVITGRRTLVFAAR